jgi:peptide deformylase
MALLPVLVYGDQKLRRKSTPVDPSELPGLQTFFDDMIETMYAEDGIGLAAPQVDVPRRIVVVDVTWVDKQVKEPIVMVNPTVEAYGEPCDFDEGCLSVPEVRGKVVRPSQARLTWLDRDGTAHAVEADGMLARCVQHEMDHLEGVLFVDRLSAAGKALVSGKLKRLSKGR